jgi:Sulfotransferase family
MIRNALVLGTGRSGTSLLAGLFHSAGYFSGESLWPATISNPLGYFEDVEINAINEDLLDKVAPWRPRGLVGALLPILRDRPRWSQRWLAILPEGTQIESDPALDRRMAAQAARRPYLFKDPRFAYTLSTWMPHLAEQTTFLCIFREPQATINSIMRIVRDERYLRDLRMTPEMASKYWITMYQSILCQRHTIGGDWLFIHYDELLAGRAIPLLESHLGARADLNMLQADLKRSTMAGSAGPAADSLARTLFELAEQKYS